jgi:hypothetical protein
MTFAFVTAPMPVFLAALPFAATTTGARAGAPICAT